MRVSDTVSDFIFIFVVSIAVEAEPLCCKTWCAFYKLVVWFRRDFTERANIAFWWSRFQCRISKITLINTIQPAPLTWFSCIWLSPLKVPWREGGTSTPALQHVTQLASAAGPDSVHRKPTEAFFTPRLKYAFTYCVCSITDTALFLPYIPNSFATLLASTIGIYKYSLRTFLSRVTTYCCSTAISC